jgi:hypothetical protein
MRTPLKVEPNFRRSKTIVFTPDTSMEKQEQQPPNPELETPVEKLKTKSKSKKASTNPVRSLSPGAALRAKLDAALNKPSNEGLKQKLAEVRSKREAEAELSELAKAEVIPVPPNNWVPELVKWNEIVQELYRYCSAQDVTSLNEEELDWYQFRCDFSRELRVVLDKLPAQASSFKQISALEELRQINRRPKAKRKNARKTDDGDGWKFVSA